MNSFICKKNLMPCPTPGMCSPHGGCPGIDVEAGRKLVAENDRLFKLLERMIDQMLPVEELKDLPGYSRVLTAEALLAERDQLKAECASLRKDAERYRWLRDKAQKIPFDTPLIAMHKANGQLMCRREGLPRLLGRAEADMAIDQAMSQYTDSIVEEELKKQQVKIDAAITTLGLSTLQLPEDNPLRIALHGKPKGSTQI